MSGILSKISTEELEKELFEGPDQNIMVDIDIAMRSKTRIIQIATPEESRVINRLRQLAKTRKRKIVFWTCAAGPFQYTDTNERKPYPLVVGGKPWATNRHVTEPMTFLDFIEADDTLPDGDIIKQELDGKLIDVEVGGGANYVLLDLPNFMPSSINNGPMSAGEISLVRRIKDLREVLYEKDERKTVIIVSRDIFIPEDLKKIIPVLDWPLPDKSAITQHLKPLIKHIENSYVSAKVKKKFDKTEISLLTDSLLGLTLDEVTNTFNQSAMRNPDKKSVDSFIKCNVKAKKDIIRKSRSGLEFYDANVNIKDNVGGLSELKKWLAKRAGAYTEEAIEYGLEYPKGLLIVGIPGNGKSLIAKAIANEWNKLLLRWDVGTVFSSRVGSSEANIRAAIQTAEATAPCILWLEEIEKAFAGVGSSDKSDGGTAARVFSTFLQWLSEKNNPVFVVATANRIDQLPPELIRKGRFDEIFYVDLPSAKEREEIIKIHLRKRKFDVDNFDILSIINATKDFTGAEIESVIKEGMYTAFADNARPLNSNDIISEAKKSIPQATKIGPQIDDLRAWASVNAKWASKQDDNNEELNSQLREKEEQMKDNRGGLEMLPSDTILSEEDDE